MIKVFSQEWFKKYNKAITLVARLPFIGELIFNFKKFGHYIDRKKIVEVTPNSVIEFIGYKKGKVELKQHFFVRNEYALRLQKVFYPIWIAFHTWDMLIANNFCPQLNLGFDTLTVYPDEGSGSTTVDGFVAVQSYNNTFANIRTANGTYASALVQTRGVYLQSKTTTNYYVDMERFIATLDTSSLTSGASISSVVFSLYGDSKRNDLGSPDLHICASSPTNDNALVAGDFQTMGTTSFGSISYADFSITGYNDITLNASGISSISKTGISKLGAKFSWDITGDTTGLTWESNKFNYFQWFHSDYGSNKPKLVVTYILQVVAPTVTTQSATNISITSCTGNGKITDTGGANCTRRGFCYKAGTSGDPTTSDSVAYDDGDFGTGAFTKSITGLSPNTSYRVRAYAVNSAGTSYGSTVDVKTLSSFIPRTMWFN